MRGRVEVQSELTYGVSLLADLWRSLAMPARNSSEFQAALDTADACSMKSFAISPADFASENR